MIVVIDGYNLLKQIFPGIKGSLEKQRALFIQHLAHYKMKKAKEISEIVVVFDAGPSTHATREVKSGVVVVFSGTRSSADNWILAFVERKKGQELLVVTLDRELLDACKRLGADVLSVYDFYNIMQQNLLEDAAEAFAGTDQHTIIEKYDNIGLVECDNYSIDTKALDILMEQASVGITKDIDLDETGEAASLKKSKAHKLSKKERRIATKLKKLA